MRERGDDHFIRSLTLALAVLALLLFLLSRLIPPLVVVPKADLVEVQLTGSGGRDGGGAPAGGTPEGSAGRRAALPAPARAPTPPPALPAQAPTPQQASPQPQTTLPLREDAAGPSATAETGTAGTAGSPGEAAGSQEATGEGGGGGGAGTGAGSGSGAGSGTEDLFASAPPATIADIDPIPLLPISAPYPAMAKRLGQQGLVRIRADIDKNGKVTDCAVRSSSGFASLDSAALDAVRSTRFMPAMKNGRPVDSVLLVPIRFRLNSQ